MILDILAYFIMFVAWVAVTSGSGCILLYKSDLKEGFKTGLLIHVAMAILLGVFLAGSWAFGRIVS